MHVYVYVHVLPWAISLVYFCWGLGYPPRLARGLLGASEYDYWGQITLWWPPWGVATRYDPNRGLRPALYPKKRAERPYLT